MADKEERDWADIIEEARTKATHDINELIADIKPKVKSLVEKARKANFQEEAEGLLKKLRGISDELTKEPKQKKAPQGKTTSKQKQPSSDKEARDGGYIYKDDEGKYWKRARRSWSSEEKQKYKL